MIATMFVIEEEQDAAPVHARMGRTELWKRPRSERLPLGEKSPPTMEVADGDALTAHFLKRLPAEREGQRAPRFVLRGELCAITVEQR
jgi:hypothetical protein